MLSVRARAPRRAWSRPSGSRHIEGQPDHRRHVRRGGRVQGVGRPHASGTARSPSLAWVSNNSIQTLIRKADIYGGSSFWADLREGVPPTLMGAPIYESSAMTGTVTTGSDVLLAGRFEDYAIIDRLRVTLLYQPMVLGTNSRPMGRWFAMKRTSANVLNADSFRLLRL